MGREKRSHMLVVLTNIIFIVSYKPIYVEVGVIYSRNNIKFHGINIIRMEHWTYILTKRPSHKIANLLRINFLIYFLQRFLTYYAYQRNQGH